MSGSKKFRSLILDESRIYFLELIVFLFSSRRLCNRKKFSFDIPSIINHFYRSKRDIHWLLAILSSFRLNFPSIFFSFYSIIYRSTNFLEWKPTKQGPLISNPFDILLQRHSRPTNSIFIELRVYHPNHFFNSELRNDLLLLIYLLHLQISSLWIQNENFLHYIYDILKGADVDMLNTISRILLDNSNSSHFFSNLIFHSSLVTISSGENICNRISLNSSYLNCSNNHLPKIFQQNDKLINYFSGFKLSKCFSSFDMSTQFYEIFNIFEIIKDRFRAHYTFNAFLHILMKTLSNQSFEEEILRVFADFNVNPDLLISFTDIFPLSQAFADIFISKDPFFHQEIYYQSSYRRKFGNHCLTFWRIYNPHLFQLCTYNILNTNYVQFPISFDEHNVANSKRAPVEDFNFKCEDERFELDIVIEAAICTLNRIKISFNQRNLSNTEYAMIFSSSITKSTLLRIYGDKYLDVLLSIRYEPRFTIPILLSRINNRIFEWKEAQFHFNKVWRENTEKYFCKSMDLFRPCYLYGEMKSVDSRMMLDIDIFDLENYQTFNPLHCSNITVCIEAPSCVDAIILVKSFLYANCMATPMIQKIIDFFEYYFRSSISNEWPSSKYDSYSSAAISTTQFSKFISNFPFYCNTHWYLLLRCFYHLITRLSVLREFCSSSIKRYAYSINLIYILNEDNLVPPQYANSLYQICFDLLNEYATSNLNLIDFEETCRNHFSKYFGLMLNFTRLFTAFLKHFQNVVNDDLFTVIQTSFYTWHLRNPSYYFLKMKNIIDEYLYIINYNMISKILKFDIINNTADHSELSKFSHYCPRVIYAKYLHNQSETDIDKSSQLYDIKQDLKAFHQYLNSFIWKDRMFSFLKYSEHCLSNNISRNNFFYKSFCSREAMNSDVDIKYMRKIRLINILRFL